MQLSSYHLYRISVGLFLLLSGCEYDYLYVPPVPAVTVPEVSEKTVILEAQKVLIPPVDLSDKYWETADYLEVNTNNDVSTKYLYNQGFLNMTGTFNGIRSFNYGQKANLKLKAAYDVNNLYILAEWNDNTVNVQQATWFWNGYKDTLKQDSADRWTSQGNDDKIVFAFEIESTYSSFGKFSEVGCAASCHLEKKAMQPIAGKMDIWNWNVSRSAMLGYAADMYSSSSGLNDDGNVAFAIRNSRNNSFYSEPAYEWDGNTQTVLLPNGKNILLDPACFLLNKTRFLGNADSGEVLFRTNCASCHKSKDFDSPVWNRVSRITLEDRMDKVAKHNSWFALSIEKRNDVFAYMKGLSGVPGYYLTMPSGNNADVTAVHNITAEQIENAFSPGKNFHSIKYSVLIIRRLKTRDADDVQFDLSKNKSYKFGVALMDNDGKNHIGSVKETLVFR